MSERILKVILFLIALLVATILVIPFTAEAQTHIHRSIQNNTSAIWTSGGTITFTITGDTIGTFSSPAPDSIGRGVAIEYDSTGSASVKAICFIKYRISSTQFGVQRFQGGNPSPASATTTWNMFHAYETWEKLHDGDENDGINNTVEAFDAHTAGVDIDARSEYWEVAFYAGSHDITTTDGSDGFNTSATERLKLYAPCGTKFVQTSQRHSGKLTFRGPVLASTGTIAFRTNDDAGTRVCQHIDFEGLQWQCTTTGGGYSLQINNAAAEQQQITITDNIFVGSDSVSTVAGTHAGIQWSGGTASVGSYLYIKNSLFYGWKTAGATTNEGAVMFTSANIVGTLLINNCTFYKNEQGVRRTNAGNTLTIKNCIFQRSADGINGGVGGDKNVSDISGDCASCTNEIVGSTLFTSTTGFDFSLRTSSNAIDAGADLSGDTLPITTDGKGYARSGTYDCGFLEFGAAAGGCSTEVDAATDNPTLRRRRNPVQ